MYLRAKRDVLWRLSGQKRWGIDGGTSGQSLPSGLGLGLFRCDFGGRRRAICELPRYIHPKEHGDGIWTICRGRLAVQRPKAFGGTSRWTGRHSGTGLDVETEIAQKCTYRQSEHPPYFWWAFLRLL